MVPVRQATLGTVCSGSYMVRESCSCFSFPFYLMDMQAQERLGDCRTFSTGTMFLHRGFSLHFFPISSISRGITPQVEVPSKFYSLWAMGAHQNMHVHFQFGFPQNIRENLGVFFTVLCCFCF